MTTSTDPRRSDPELDAAIADGLIRQRASRRAAGRPEQIEADSVLALLASAIASTR